MNYNILVNISFTAPHNKVKCIIFMVTPPPLKVRSRSHLHGDITILLDILIATLLSYNVLKFDEDVIYFKNIMKVKKEKIMYCPLASMYLILLTPHTHQKV